MKISDIRDFESLEYLLIYDDLPTQQQTNALIQVFNQFSSILVNRVLDIGCGYGRHAIEIAKKDFNVTGIDISKKAIEIAKRKTPSELNISYFVEDIRTFASNSLFDVAYAHNSTMAYFVDDNDFNDTLRNIYSLLKKGGLFVFDYFYPTNLVKNNQYSKELHQRKTKNNLTIDKISKHEIDTEKQIHQENSIYVFSDETEQKNFKTRETLRYYEPDQIINLLKQKGFSEINVRDRNTYSSLTNNTAGIYVIAKK